MTQRRQRPKNTKTTGVITLAILPKGKWLLPMGKQLFVCDRVCLGRNFHGYVRRTTKQTNFDKLKFTLSYEACGNKTKEKCILHY